MPSTAQPPTHPFGLQDQDLGVLEAVASRAHASMAHMIWEANHRANALKTDPKVGGHPAACASSLHIATALHMVARHPSDYYCAKPHLAPLDHCLHHLMGNMRNADGSWMEEDQAEAVMHRLRSFSKEGEPVFQSYHAAGDPDSWRILPSGTVGIPPVVSAYLSLAYAYLEDHGFGKAGKKHFWSLIGDSEFREGSLMEALPDIAERELGNITWIIDYNRQNLDGTRIPNDRGLRGTDADRIERTAKANGWDVIQLRHGSKRREVFKQPGGDLFQKVLESSFGDYAFQTLLWKRDAETLRKALTAKESSLTGILDSLDDATLLEVFADLGGHDFGEVLRALEESRSSEQVPVMIIAHTVKGWGMESYAAPGNHSTIPLEKEVESLLAAQGLSMDAPYAIQGSWAEDENTPAFLAARRDFWRDGVQASLNRKKENLENTHAGLEPFKPVPEDFGIDLSMMPIVHTQWLWGQVAGRLVRIGTRDDYEAAGMEAGRELTSEENRWEKTADLILTLSPDVGTSTNINPAMDAKIYGPDFAENIEEELGLSERGRPELFPTDEPWTRHIRFEIAEANCMSAMGSFGMMGKLAGVPFLPLMTIYDFFIKRALDQLYYNLYWGSSFILVGTPSGVTLSPEGAQHSWKSDLQMPNLITWEPFFAREMEWILADSIRRHLEDDHEDRSGVLIRGVTMGVEQRELLRRMRTQSVHQGEDGEPLPDHEILPELRTNVLAGGYWLINQEGDEGYTPGENVVRILAMGAPVAEAVAASDRLLEVGIHADVLVVTSADLLLGRLGEKSGFAQLNKLGLSGDLHLHAADASSEASLMAGRTVPLVSVVDGEPGLLDNAGSILGVRQESLAVQIFSKSGTPADVFAYQGIDGDAIFQACGKVLAQTAQAEVRISPETAARIAGKPATAPPPDWRELWPYSSES
jgi:pyruvate dehydrogenase E1 component